MNTHTETKHTPGPWFSACAGSTHIQVVVWDEQLDQPKGLVAEVNKRIAMEPDGSSQEAAANARLIAAAPELLEALRAVLSDFTPEHLDKIGVSNCGTLARAAIAKATEGAQ